MPVYNYAEQFQSNLQKKYAVECKSDLLTKSNQDVKFLNAQVIKLPTLTLSGYKDHTRTPGFNSGTISNNWVPKKLEFDRDIEFFIDPMDIDETNLVLSVANIQNTFEETQAIPEKDCYRFSKLYSELNTINAQNISTDVIDATNFLEVFDEAMCNMDEAGVPEGGRIMYVTPTMAKIVKNAKEIERTIIISGASQSVNRNVHSLDDVQIIKVPSDRMKTAYDFSNGFAASSTAGQINMILIHPSCVVCRDKYSYIKLFTPGSDSRTGDGYIYQNRCFGDLFLLELKASGAVINITPRS